MSHWLIATSGLIYLGVAIDQYIKGSLPNVIVYLAYALANVGLWMLAKD